MAESFDLSSDLGNVHWGATVALNGARLLIGGVVLAALFLLATGDLRGVLLIGTPLFWLFFGLPTLLLFHRVKSLGQTFDWALAALNIGFLVVGLAGDPLLFALAKYRPDLIGIEKLSFMTFKAHLFVSKQ